MLDWRRWQTLLPGALCLMRFRRAGGRRAKRLGMRARRLCDSRSQLWPVWDVLEAILHPHRCGTCTKDIILRARRQYGRTSPRGRSSFPRSWRHPRWARGAPLRGVWLRSGSLRSGSLLSACPRRGAPPGRRRRRRSARAEGRRPRRSSARVEGRRCRRFSASLRSASPRVSRRWRPPSPRVDCVLGRRNMARLGRRNSQTRDLTPEASTTRRRVG